MASSLARKTTSCSCFEHETFSKGTQTRVIKFSSNKIRVGTIQYLKEEGLIPPHALGICEACKQQAENLMKGDNPKKAKLDLCDTIVKQINNGEISKSDIIKVVQAIGTSISSDILSDAENISQSYNSENFIESFQINNWLEKRNDVLVKFLQSVADIENLENKKKARCLAGCVDSIYKARKLNLVTPIQFYKNLVSYYISGSSTLAKINSTCSPSGSYNCLKKWLNNLSSVPMQLPASDDIVTYFDNNQVVARNWRITYNHKTTASVITTFVHINPQTESNLQKVEGLSPEFWLYNVNDNSHVIPLIENSVRSSEKVYNNIRDQFVAQRIQQVQKEQTLTHGQLTDEVDRKIAVSLEPNLTRSSSDPYNWVKCEHPCSAPVVTVGEPCMTNPCSFDSVKKVLTHIQHQSDVGNDKKWTVVGCDGLPYTLAQKLVKRTEEFNNILLVPGNGHIEMNSTRSIFKLLWDVVLEDLAKLNGFRTPRALLSAKNCSSHHKSWELLMIFLFGTMDELIRTFLLFCSSKSKPVTLSEFYNYIANSNANYRFMCDVIFNNVLALFVFRCGVRRGNFDFINAGKHKIMKLYFGMNMTTYQFLTFCDLKTQVLAPDTVKAFLEATESFSCSGNESKGEGGDFVLEAVNGKTKRWLPTGIPTQTHWKQVCRNIDRMEQIRTNLYQELGIKKKPASLYQRDLSLEIFQWRVKLRESRYLLNENPANNTHTSINGTSLDRELLTYEKKCNANFNIYMDTIANGHEPGKAIKLTPVFVTLNDRDNFHDIRKKTKAQIINIIRELINDVRRMGNELESLVLEKQWEKIKVGTKEDILQMYREVVAAVEDASNKEQFEKDDNEDYDSSDCAESDYEQD